MPNFSVLIVRSAQMFQFNKAFEDVSLQEKGSIHVLSQEGSEKEIIYNTGLDKTRILTYPHKKPFNIFRLKTFFASNKIPDLKLCVIIYNNSTGNGYFHVNTIPILVKAKRVRVYFLNGEKKEYSRTGFVLHCLRSGIIEILDQLAALSLLLTWGMFIFPFFRYFAGKNKYSREDCNKVYFFTSQDKSYPSAKVRCFDFANQLEEHGFFCKVFSLQNLLENEAFLRISKDSQAEEFSDTVKVFSSIRLFFKEVRNPPGILYVQKLKYNSLTPFMLYLVRKDTVILDMDDWEFPTQAFRYIKCDALFLRFSFFASALVAASHRLEERMKIFHKNVYLIPTVPDTKRFYPKRCLVAPSKCVFGWAGIIFGHPILENIIMALEAFSRLPNQVVMKIAGKGPLWQDLKEYVKNTIKDDRIEFCGWVPSESMPDFLNSIDVGLMPIARKNPFLESKSPTKLFEYMAVGLPTISSPVGEILHVIEHKKNGFLASNVDEFSHYMEILASNPSLREKLGGQALESVKNRYNQKSIGNDLKNLIESLLIRLS